MKKTIALLSFLCLILISCQHKERISYKELVNLNPSHIICTRLQSKISELIRDTTTYSKFKSPICLITIRKTKSEFEVCISKTDYNVFIQARPDNFKILKGNSKVQNIPVLLFGDIDSNFFNKTNFETWNFLGDMPKYDFENPPIVYEPRMICRHYRKTKRHKT